MSAALLVCPGRANVSGTKSGGPWLGHSFWKEARHSSQTEAQRWRRMSEEAANRKPGAGGRAYSHHRSGDGSLMSPDLHNIFHTWRKTTGNKKVQQPPGPASGVSHAGRTRMRTQLGH